MGKQKMGILEVIAGCMFSGKTEELIRRLDKLQYGKKSFLLFKPSIDNRYDEEAVVTHYGRKFKALLLEPFKENLRELISIAGKRDLDEASGVIFDDENLTKLISREGNKALDEASVIAFDEGNLFSPKLTSLCNMLVRRGKRVIVAGLDLTFAGKPFKPMPSLMAHAFPVDKLAAICVKCGGVATRSQRLIDGIPAPASDPIIKVGGIGTYEARCRACYEEPQ